MACKPINPGHTMKNAALILLSRLLALVLVATAGFAHAQPTPPTVSTLPASAVGATNATLNGSANPDGLAMSGWFEWGTTTNYGSITPAQALGSGSGNTNFSQVVAGLVGGVTYHFRAVASNSFYVVRGTNQSFTTPVFNKLALSLSGVTRGSVAWGDYDNDGRLDFISTGATNLGASRQTIGAISQVWRNTTNGFVNVTSVVAPGLPGVGSSSVAWGDYDNDGRLDFLLTGFDPSGGVFSQIWRNTGSGFTNINAGLPGVAGGSAVWGDYDNDGRLDLLLTGISGNDYLAQIWRNTGSGFTNATLLATLGLGLPGVVFSSASWADYDNDGRLDFLLMGATNLDINGLITGSTSQLWRNTGNGFVKVTSSVIPGLPSISLGSAAWGDYDSDGRLDLLLTGGTNAIGTLGVAQIWRNTGSGFTNINAGLSAISDSSVAWGDYDNDGRQDILLTGLGSTGFISQIWRNTSNGFTNINAALTGVGSPSATWADFDNDGRLDFLFTGTTNYSARSNFVSQVWRNNSPATNTPPNAPTGLAVTASGGVATFSWNTATDAQTLSDGLTYNLRIGTTPGGSDVLAPAASPGGFRRVPQIGNAQQGLTAVLSYQPGTPYYWSVQAVDGAFAGSPFSSEGSFRIFQAPPIVALVTTTNLGTGDLNGDGLVDQSELNIVLSNYFPNSPWLYLTNVAGLGGTNVTFALSNSTAGAFSVEYTTNLSNWYLLGPATPRYLFTDTNAPGQPQRSYRLRWP